MFKIVLDTNVLIDALKDKSSHTWQILEWQKMGEVECFASYKILGEYKLIIEREVASEKDRRELENFISDVNVIEVRHRVQVIEYDPEDDKFVNLALSANADFIVSSDRHLLDVEEYEGIKMVDPDEFYFLMKGEKDPNGRGEWAELFGNLFQ